MLHPVRTATRRPHLLVILCTVLLMVLAAASASAYTVYLKDGSKIIAKTKYRVEGDKAIITLPSGTETFLAADQIDVERSQRANQKEYGTAVVIEGGKRRQIEPGRRTEPPRETTLSDIAGQPGAEIRLPTSDPVAGDGTAATAKRRTASGAPDLTSVDRETLANADLAGEIEAFLSSRGLEGVKVFRGTAARRPLVETLAGSEAGVFRSLNACAALLEQLAERYPEQIEGLELLMMTASRERAGQFFMTPDQARQLTGGEIEPAQFYLRQVQF